MQGKAPIAGLHIEPEGISDSDDSIFSSDNDSQPLRPVIQLPLQPIKRISISIKKFSVQSLTDATNRIAEILTNLSNYPKNESFKGDPYFIPENSVPDELTNSLKQLAKHPKDLQFLNTLESFDSSTFPDVVLAQLALIHFTFDNKVILSPFLNKKFDSRIISLLHFCVAKTSDKNTGAYHLLSSIEEYIKFQSPAPISIFFPDFSLPNLFKSLCETLVNLFPHNPILPSVIQNISAYYPECSHTIDGISDTDSTDMSDDDFFKGLQEISKPNVTRLALSLNRQGDENINPLATPISQAPTIIVKEPPSTATILLTGKSDQMSKDPFEQWLMSMRYSFNSFTLLNPKTILETDQKTYSTFPILDTRGFFSSEPITSKITANKSRRTPSNISKSKLLDFAEDSVDEDAFGEISNDDSGNIPTSTLPSSLSSNDFENPFLSLYERLYDSEFLDRELPANLLSTYFNIGLSLPILHVINEHLKPARLHGILDSIIPLEYEAHKTLREGDPTQPLLKICQLVNNTEDFSKVVISSLPFDKKIPFTNGNPTRKPLTEQEEKELIEVLAVTDVSLILSGRSPLSMDTFPSRVRIPTELEGKNIVDCQWRLKYLYNKYTSEFRQKLYLMPYVAFRITFAISLELTISQTNPQLPFVCSLVFEGLYIISQHIPNAKNLPCLRSALLFFGELLQKTDRYYFTAYAFDDHFLSDINNASYSPQIAKTALANNDWLRAAFHYSLSLRNFIAHASIDEALFTGQILCSIFTDVNDYQTAASILSLLLGQTYKLPISHHLNTTAVSSLGSLRVTKARCNNVVDNISAFVPSAKSVLTVYTALNLAKLFSKIGQRAAALDLLQQIESQCDASSIVKTAKYVRAYVLVHQNNIHAAYSAVKPSQLQIQRNGGHSGNVSHFSLLNATQFDPSMAIFKLFAKAALDREQALPALFWSEAYVHSSIKASPKELGNALYLRGLSLTLIYRNISTFPNPNSITLLFSEFTVLPEFGFDSSSSYLMRFAKPIFTLTKLELISEIVSCFSMSIACYERVGCSAKQVSVLLALSQTLLQWKTDLRNSASNESMDKIDVSDISETTEPSNSNIVEETESRSSSHSSRKIKSAQIGQPVGSFSIGSVLAFPEMSVNQCNYSSTTFSSDSSDDVETQNRHRKNQKDRDQESSHSRRPREKVVEFTIGPPYLFTLPQTEDWPIKAAPSKISSSTVLDKVSQMLSNANSIAERLMMPVELIYCEVLYCHLMHLKRRSTSAKSYLETSFTNITDFYACGGSLNSDKYSLSHLRRLENIIMLYIEVLFNYSSKLINERLVIIDLLNSIQTSIRILLTSSPRQLTGRGSITPTLNLPRSALHLQNPLLPDFAKILEETGLLPPAASKTQPEGLMELTRHIYANLRLFDQQKITEEQCRERNVILVKQLKENATQKRRSNEGRIPAETTYSYALRVSPRLKGLVFLVKLHGEITIYSPNKGTVRSVKLHAQPKSSDHNVTLTKGNQIFDDYNGLFTRSIMDFAIAMLISDKKVNKSATATKMNNVVSISARTSLFGNFLEGLAFDTPDVQDIIPDDSVKKFGRNTRKGRLSTLNPGDSPLIFVMSPALQFIPLETFYSTCAVIRSPSFCRLLLRAPTQAEIKLPHFVAFRIAGDGTKLNEIGFERTVEDAQRAIAAVDGKSIQISSTIGSIESIFNRPFYEKTGTTSHNNMSNHFEEPIKDHTSLLPFTLFSSNQTIETYQKKYPFCTFVEYESGMAPIVIDGNTALYILMYADLLEMPQMLIRLLETHPNAFFMFIPSIFVREAFEEMAEIFERNEKRSEPITNPFQFVATIQLTLSRDLECPIPLIGPIH